MVLNNKTFRIFVSSTFSDLKEERNALQQEVFPKLRELCIQHGFKFQAIDLRWGVSEEAGLDQQTMKICLEEIERSQRISPKPNFIVLLGNRYGWRPLPSEIEAREFNEIISKVSAEEKECLIWKEEQAEDKKGWYRLDENAVPAVYCLQPRKGIYEKYENWTPVEQKLHSILLKAASKLNLSEEDFLKYYASATEQEIVRGALKVEDAKDHVFCFFRNIENLPDDKNFVDLDSDGNIDEDAREKLGNLKQNLREQLPESHVKEYNAEWTNEGVSKNHLKDLCEDVYDALKSIILNKIEEVEDKKPLDQEIEAHEEFRKDRAKFFTGRTEILKDISDYLDGGNNSPLAIYGESGSGKSALMAKAVQDAQNKYPDNVIITRFIGATPASSDVRSLLESLCKQISIKYGDDESNVPSEYNDLIKEFPEKLKLADLNEKPLYIFLDALDQLSSADNAHSLNWLPENLPDNVHIVVSSLEENFYDILKNKIPEENLLKLYGLDKEQGENLLKLWLKDGKRTLQSKQLNEIIDKFHIEGLPLYLKLAFEEAKSWKSYTETSELESDIPGIIKQMFNRLSADSNHGSLIVDRSLGYLAASKNGLSEDEIIDVLSRDKDVFYDFIYRARSEPTEILNAAKAVLSEEELKENTWALFEEFQNDKDFCFDVFDRMDKYKISFKLPVAIWSRLYFDLEPYLSERNADETSLFAFYHRQLGEVVAEEFLQDKMKIEKHRALARYFLDQDLKTEKDNEIVYNVRKVSELPYQEIYGELWKDLEETLCDLRFVEAKCAVWMTYDLIEDYNLALDLHPDEQKEKKKRLEHEKRLNKYVKDLITYSEEKIDHLDIIPSVKIRTEEEKREDIKRIINNPTNIDRIKVFSKFLNSQSHLLAQFGHLHGFCLQTAYNYADSDAISKSAKIIVNERTNEILILRKDNWLEKYNPYPILLKTLPHPNWVTSNAISQDGKLIVTGCKDGTIRIWETKTGKELRALKKHENINGLTLTPDGKIAATYGNYLDKKLCVWDLKNYKLLNELESPDNTISVDITPNGKNLVIGGYNGVIYVWDLKRDQNVNNSYDPSNFVNEVAITPDQKIAVTASQNNCIYIWDLVEKKLLNKLESHTGFVNSVAITPDGKKAISGSADCTVRVWDLETGENLKTLKNHMHYVNTVAITPDGKKAISGDVEGNVYVWDLETSDCLKTLPGHTDSIRSVAMTPDGKIAITASNDNTTRVWDMEKGSSTLEMINGLISMDTTLDGKVAITSYINNTTYIWDLKQGKHIKTLKGHKERVNITAISSDEKMAVTGGGDGILNLWNFKTGKLIKKLQGHIYGVLFALITPDGKAVITGNKNGDIIIWIFERNKQIKMKGHTKTIYNAIITPDGKILITASEDKSARVWDLQTGNCVHILNHSDGMVSSLYITPNGSILITKSSDYFVRIWDLKTGELLKIEKVNTIDRNLLAVSPEGKTAIIGKSDSIIYHIDLESGKRLKKINIDGGKILTLAISPDGEKIAIGCRNGSIHLFNLKSGKKIAFSKENSSIIFLRIKANRNLVVGASNGEIFCAYFKNLAFGIPLITATRIWSFNKKLNSGSWDKNIKADCQLCGKRFIVSDKIIFSIRKLEEQYKKMNAWIADDAWEDPRLITECPYCHGKLKFNPFIVDNSDEISENLSDNQFYTKESEIKEKIKKSKWKFWK